MGNQNQDQLLKPSYKSATFYGRAFVTVVSMLAASGAVKPQTAAVLQNTADMATSIAPQVVQIVQVIIDGIIQLVGLVTGAVIMLKQGKEQTDVKTAYIAAAKKG
jgi:hypothetical protein